MLQQRQNPIGGPAPFGGIINVPQRLKRQATIQAQIMVRPAHAKRGGSGGVTLVENVDLGFCVTAELHRHQRQQHRLTRARRPDNQTVANIADMGRKSKWRRTGGFGME
jgi:hypothetical protein